MKIKKIFLEKYKHEKKEYWLCYCDRYGKYSCYGNASTPEKALKQFLIDYKDFKKVKMRV